jgi:hypothetical protein
MSMSDAAADRVGAYIKARKSMPGADPQEIHSVWTGGTDARMDTLYVSDLERLVKDSLALRGIFEALTEKYGKRGRS